MTLLGADPCRIAAHNKMRTERIRQSTREGRLPASRRPGEQKAVVDVVPGDAAGRVVLDVALEFEAPVLRGTVAMEILKPRTVLGLRGDLGRLVVRLGHGAHAFEDGTDPASGLSQHRPEFGRHGENFLGLGSGHLRTGRLEHGALHEGEIELQDVDDLVGDRACLRRENFLGLGATADEDGAADAECDLFPRILGADDLPVHDAVCGLEDIHVVVAAEAAEVELLVGLLRDVGRELLHEVVRGAMPRAMRDTVRQHHNKDESLGVAIRTQGAHEVEVGDAAIERLCFVFVGHVVTHSLFREIRLVGRRDGSGNTGFADRQDVAGALRSVVAAALDADIPGDRGKALAHLRRAPVVRHADGMFVEVDGEPAALCGDVRDRDAGELARGLVDEFLRERPPALWKMIERGHTSVSRSSLKVRGPKSMSGTSIPTSRDRPIEARSPWLCPKKWYPPRRMAGHVRWA